VTWNPGTSSASLCEPEDLPLPRGLVEPNCREDFLVGVTPPHPSNRVAIQVRNPHGETTSAQSVRWPTTLPMHAVGSPARPGEAQWFSASLPGVDPGGGLEYRVILSRFGQWIAALPSDGSWLSLIASPAPRSRPDTVQPENPPLSAAVPSNAPANKPSTMSAPKAPRWTYHLDFLAALTVDLRAEILGATPEGYRINFFVKDGAVRGPSIDAVVLPEGGDWMCIRPDGIGMVDITITYQTTDGALILERSGGVFDLGPDGYAKVVAGQFSGAPPFYATPSWETAHPSWQWLNRRQGFGVGRVVLDELQVRCDIYLPTVGGALPGV
jgi:hypothetical protein